MTKFIKELPKEVIPLEVPKGTLLAKLRMYGIGCSSAISLKYREHKYDNKPEIKYYEPVIISTKPIPSNVTLAIIPESAIINVNNTMDSDKTGIIPHLSEVCECCEEYEQESDAIYLAHCVSLICMTNKSCWFDEQLNAYRNVLQYILCDKQEYKFLFEIYNRINNVMITAPLQVFLAAYMYVKSSAYKYSVLEHGDQTYNTIKSACKSECATGECCKKNTQCSEKKLILAPLLDMINKKRISPLCNEELAANKSLSMERTTAKDIRQILKNNLTELDHRKLHKYQGVRQYLRRKDDEYVYYMLKTMIGVDAGNVLSM